MDNEKREFDGDIPVLHVTGNGIAEAWENSVAELYKYGAWYARQGPKDKGRLHVDSTMTMTVKNPDSPLFAHKYVCYDFADLLGYEMEMLGAVNSLVHNPSLDPADDTRWNYHYSDRFLRYPCSKGNAINQLEEIIRGMVEEPWSRRHNAITWVPEKDLPSKDPPCLQRIWAYIAPVVNASSNVQEYKLNMNYNFRSRNVMQAAPMNLRGMHILQCFIRDELIKRTGMSIKNGRLVDFTDSYHVSAHDLPILEGFMKRLTKALTGQKPEEATIEGRCFPREVVQEQYDALRPVVEAKIIQQVRNRFEERGVTKELEEEIEKIRQIAATRKG